MTTRTATGVALVALSLIASSAPAAAQTPAPDHPFGVAGRWSFAVESALGVGFQSDTRTNTGNVQTSNTIDLFASPRLGVDRFFARGLSLGASLWLNRSSTSLQMTPPAPPPSGTSSFVATNTSGTSVVFDPRVGFAARLNPWLWLWPRAGITLVYSTATGESGGQTAEDSSSFTLDLSIDAPLVFRVAPHVALTAAPSFDRTLWMKTTINVPPAAATGVDHDTLTEVGLHAGLLVYL
jgi:hypothetical protein